MATEKKLKIEFTQKEVEDIFIGLGYGLNHVNSLLNDRKLKINYEQKRDLRKTYDRFEKLRRDISKFIYND